LLRRHADPGIGDRELGKPALISTPALGGQLGNNAKLSRAYYEPR
jgi:hypothetical protein